MALPNWSPSPPEWSPDTYNLLIQNNITEPLPLTIQQIIQNSDKFPIKFPVDTGRCKTLKSYTSQSILEKNINSVYPVIHENALELCCKFILHKRNNGSTKEKGFYKNMTLVNFINRLLTKRAVMFMGRYDKYILLNGVRGSNGWETIRTDNEQPPLVLENCLSYDEIKLSVFLSVSSYTYFVNLGDRKNMAKYCADRRSMEDQGIIIGLIGPRLRKPFVMEFQEIVISDKQNTFRNGYGSKVSSSAHQLFSKFYEEPCRDYTETLSYKNSLPSNDKRYTDLQFKSIFDNHLYYKRLVFSIDTLLLEANYRARVQDTTAYIHVVGLGLGVWRISDHQDKIYMDAFAKRIIELGKSLNSVSDICFAYIQQERCGNYKHEEVVPIEGHPDTGIKIHIFNREPHAKLLNKDAGKLLVVSYAWDGNALPGNEYWSGQLAGSGDSAAASSTQITELHNPHINPIVCGNSLRVVTKGDVVTFKQYQEMIKLKV